jgi:hypothetical protein
MLVVGTKAAARAGVCRLWMFSGTKTFWTVLRMGEGPPLPVKTTGMLPRRPVVQEPGVMPLTVLPSPPRPLPESWRLEGMDGAETFRGALAAGTETGRPVAAAAAPAAARGLTDGTAAPPATAGVGSEDSMEETISCRTLTATVRSVGLTLEKALASCQRQSSC